MDVRAVKVTIERANHAAKQALVRLQAGSAEMSEATSLAAYTTLGSHHSKVDEGLDALSKAADMAEAIAGHLRRSIDSADNYRSAL
jgi:hypothetical protein